MDFCYQSPGMKILTGVELLFKPDRGNYNCVGFAVKYDT
jgi:hypothetical protein